MPATKHRRRRVKRPRCISPTYEETIGELLCRLVDNRCLELHGNREWTLEEREAALVELTEDFVREYGPS